MVRGDNSEVIGRLEAELGVTVSVELNGLALDQQTIDIFDGTDTITFELDSDGVVTGNNTIVSLSSQASAAEVAAALAAAIEASGLNVTVNLPTTDRFGIRPYRFFSCWALRRLSLRPVVSQPTHHPYSV